MVWLWRTCYVLLMLLCLCLPAVSVCCNTSVSSDLTSVSRTTSELVRTVRQTVRHQKDGNFEVWVKTACCVLVSGTVSSCYRQAQSSVGRKQEVNRSLWCSVDLVPLWTSSVLTVSLGIFKETSGHFQPCLCWQNQISQCCHNWKLKLEPQETQGSVVDSVIGLRVVKDKPSVEWGAVGAEPGQELVLVQCDGAADATFSCRSVVKSLDCLKSCRVASLLPPDRSFLWVFPLTINTFTHRQSTQTPSNTLQLHKFINTISTSAYVCQDNSSGCQGNRRQRRR